MAIALILQRFQVELAEPDCELKIRQVCVPLAMRSTLTLNKMLDSYNQADGMEYESQVETGQVYVHRHCLTTRTFREPAIACSDYISAGRNAAVAAGGILWK